MGKFKLGVVVGCVVGLSAAEAGAGSVTMDAAIPLKGVAEVHMVTSAGQVVPVIENNEAGPNPGGITVNRGGNHGIARAANGKGIKLLRAAGDAAGSVFVRYRGYNDNGPEGRIRKVTSQNQSAFDKWLPIHDYAGIAADEAGGVYVGSHASYAKDGEAWLTMTRHTTYRLGPTGEVVWKVEETGANAPMYDAGFTSVATRSAEGVFVGYGILDAQKKSTPVLIHRNASDGSARYVRMGLTQENTRPTPSLARRPGVPGGAPLGGRVSQIFVASDGSAIATVEETHDPTIVRVDTHGVQTAVYTCGPNGGVVGHQNGEVSCVHGWVDGSIAVERYAIKDGNLALVGSYKTAAVAGWQMQSGVGLASGELLAAGTRNGKAAYYLYSAAGAPLGAASGIAGSVLYIGAAGGKYVAVGPEVSPNWIRYVGTYDVTPPAATPTVKPKLRRLPGL